MFVIDKLFLLKINRLPVNIDEKLDKSVGETLLSIVLFHCIFASWIFGNENYFDQVPEILAGYGDGLEEQSTNYGLIERFFVRLSKP